jgi:hypothetical protein
MAKRKSFSRSPKKSMKRSPKKSMKRSPKKSKVRIPVMKGKLSKYGYHVHDLQTKRYKSLERATKEYGALSVFKKLNVLVTFNKNVHPELSKKFKKDREWVKKNLMD